MIKKDAALTHPTPIPSPGWGGLGWGLCLASLFLFLTGCTSVRPIVKIGLIAPFEGLYRASGYAALEGMRQAVTECTPPGMDVLPLALDDSGDPDQARRAARKLLVDPTVRAVIGPLLLDAVPAVSSVIAHATTGTNSVAWYIPSLGVATENNTENSLGAQIDYVAAATSATRVFLLGLPTTWQIPITTTVPTQHIDELDRALASVTDDSTDHDAMLWLGRPDVGASWYVALRQANPDIEFWLADQAGIDIFAAQVAAQTDDLGAAHWLVWANSDYNQRLQSDDAAIQPTEATREVTYQATCAALQALGTSQSARAEGHVWGYPVSSPTSTNAR